MSGRDGRTRLGFVGDVSLGFLKHSPPHVDGIPGWSDFERAMGQVDLLVGNFECCLVDARCPADAGDLTMATPVHGASLLARAGFSVMNLANNHMLDCGPGALRVTRERLNAAGIDTFGAGENIAAAERVLIREAGGLRIAFLGVCDSERYYATSVRAGIAPLNEARLLAGIDACRAKADLVVVTIHADLEFTPGPAPWRRDLSRRLVARGADLVIQHHPHVLQGLEYYGDGLIAYSLGNFIFAIHGNRYQAPHAGVTDTAVLVVDVERFDGELSISHRIVPATIQPSGFPKLRTDDNAAAVAGFSALSRNLQCSARLRHEWYRRCQVEARNRFWTAYYDLRRLRLRAVAAQLWRILSRRRERRWVLGLLSAGRL